MTKETPELIAEAWQLLVEYIPRRDQAAAAEQLFTYLSTVLSKEEQEAISDLDGDLAEAYVILKGEEDFNYGYEEDENDEMD